MILGIGNKAQKGFTLIEVLLSVSILAVSMAGVMGAYGQILGSYKKARLSIEGMNILQEKMAEQELIIRAGQASVGSMSGKEKIWSWSTEVKPAKQEGWYEIKGEVKGEGRTGAITVYDFVRP